MRRISVGVCSVLFCFQASCGSDPPVGVGIIIERSGPDTPSAEASENDVGRLGATLPTRHWARGSVHVLAWARASADAGAQRAVALTPPVSTGTSRIEISSDRGLSWTTELEVDLAAGEVLWRVPDDSPRLLDVRLVRSDRDPPELLYPSVHVVDSQERDYKVVTLAYPNVTPRDGAGAVVFDDRMWLIGGWNPLDPVAFPRTTSNDVWSSRDGVSWTLDKPNTFVDDDFDGAADWAGRHTAGYAVHDGRMWIVGGDTANGDYQMDVWSSSNGRNWVRATAAAPFPERVLLSSVSFRGSLYAYGGQHWDGTFFNDVWRSTDGSTWQKMPDTTPRWSGRGSIEGAAVLGDRMWVVGGGRYATATTPWEAFRDVWSSVDGVVFRREGDEVSPWSARTYHTVIVHDDRIFVLGGYDEVAGNLGDAWYTKDGENWYPITDPVFRARHAASAWSYHGSLYFGFGNTEGFTADVVRID